jgi:hypothetical protein
LPDRQTTWYADDLSLAEARARYFRDNGFDADGGYSRRWFKVGWKWLAVPLPNTASRVRAVRVHDFHHIATGYPTTWRGEAEIGAWELAGGCGDYFPAWLLNFYSFAIGLVIAPRRLWQAFLSGRRCFNLYYGVLCETELLGQSVGELRRHMGLDAGAKIAAREQDRFDFLVIALIACMQAALTAAPFVAAAILILIL